MSEQSEITLRQYYDARWDAHRREHELIDKALAKAEESMNKRLEGMNEFRAQLNSQQATFSTKNEVTSAIRPLQQFQDRFLGVILGVTLLNALVTTLVVLVLKR